MTKTTYQRLLLLAALPALSLASCSQDEPGGNDADSRTPVAFTSVVQWAALPQHADAHGPTTRTALDPGGNAVWTRGDAVNIFMLSAGGTLPADIVSDYADVRHNVDPDNGALMPAGGTPMYYPSNAAVDFIAWHTALTPDTDYILSLNTSDQTTAEKQLALDALYSDNARGISRSHSPVVLQFRHLMSKVKFDISLGAELAGGTLTEVRLEGMAGEGSLDMRDGSVKELLPPREPIHALKSDAAPDGAAATYTALLIPQQGNANSGPRTIVVTVDGKEYTGSIPGTDAYEANEVCTYPVTVSNAGVEVGIRDTNMPWTNGITTIDISGKTFRLIHSAEDLARYAADVNAGQLDLNALQTADIDLNDLKASTNPDYRALADNWVPINEVFSVVDIPSFTGIYNGNGHTISGLRCSSASNYYFGLFGAISNGALLTGIHLRDVNITISEQPFSIRIGALAASIQAGGTVSLCSATGKMEVSCRDASLYIGGLVGTAYGSIIRSQADVSITGDCTTYWATSAYAGGITGGDFGLLFACRTKGSITLTGRYQGNTPELAAFGAGGIAGHIIGKLYGCVAQGDVYAECETPKVPVYAGGLAGIASNGDIKYNYARGTAEAKAGAAGTTARAGALVGSNSIPLSNCYGAGSIGKGTSTLRAVADNIVYNASPAPGDILKVIAPKGASLSDIPFTHFDPDATPAYGIDVSMHAASPADFWLPGDDTWPVPDFTQEN